jgi:hypothetical protein
MHRTRIHIHNLLILSPFVLQPVFGGGKFDHGFESAGKIKSVLESGHASNFFNAEVGGIKQLASLMHPQPDEIIHGRVTGLVFEQSTVM